MSQLKRVEIKNIKAIDTFSIDFLDNKKLVLLIGHNNSGKTSILESIKFLFSNDQKADEFWPLNDDGTYKELREKPYILAEISYSTEEISKIKEELKKTNQDNELNKFLVNDNTLIIKKTINKTTKGIKAKDYECKRKDNDIYENFTGLIPNMTRFIPRYIYLPSLASIEDYISASQKAEHTFEELFELYFEGQWEENEEIKNLVSKLISKINELIGIEDIKQKIDSYLKEIEDISVEKLEHGFQSVSDVANIIKKVKIALNDGIISDARLKGRGTQRGLIFSLLRLIAEKRRNDMGRETIFLIDEPDLHLHPQLQKQVKVIIEKLSKNYPVLIATHSHLMIGKKIPAVGIIKKIYKENNVVRSEDISDKEKFFRELFTYLGYVPSDFFLPDNIIFVSGKLDKVFLDKVIEILKNNKKDNNLNNGEEIGYNYDVSVIDVGGDGQISKAFEFIKDIESAVSFFQGLPAYKNRFCAILDAKKENSLSQLRKNANDNNEPYRVIVLNEKKDENGDSLDGIEFYYPESLTTKYCEDNKISLKQIVKDDEQKKKLSDFILNNLTIDNFDEIKKIVNLINLAFKKAGIL